LGGDAVFVGQFLQRDLAVGVQPAAPDDVARAGVEPGHAFAQHLQLVGFAVGGFIGGGRVGVVGDQIADRRRRGVVVVGVVGRVETDVAAGQARLHLHHFTLGDV